MSNTRENGRPIKQMSEEVAASIGRAERQAKNFWDVCIRNKLKTDDVVAVSVLLIAQTKKFLIKIGRGAEWLVLRDRLIKNIKEL